MRKLSAEGRKVVKVYVSQATYEEMCQKVGGSISEWARNALLGALDDLDEPEVQKAEIVSPSPAAAPRTSGVRDIFERLSTLSDQQEGRK